MEDTPTISHAIASAPMPITIHHSFPICRTASHSYRPKSGVLPLYERVSG